VLKLASRLKRPQLDLSARMAVCDANYLRLLKLLPEFTQGLNRTILLSAAAEPAEPEYRLELHVSESFRYTSTLSVTLVVPQSAPTWFRTPQLTVRLYHDAGTAEVVGYQDQRGFKAVYLDDEAPRFTWDEKNQINLFLAEWLTLCLDGGLARLTLPECLRSMPPADEPSAETASGD